MSAFDNYDDMISNVVSFNIFTSRVKNQFKLKGLGERMLIVGDLYPKALNILINKLIYFLLYDVKILKGIKH